MASGSPPVRSPAPFLAYSRFCRTAETWPRSVPSSRPSFAWFRNPRDFLQQSPLICWHVCETIAHRLGALSAYVSDVRRQFAGTDHLAMMSDVLATLLQRQPAKRIRPSESTRLQGEMMD
jgi:hypothetical protein